MNSYPDSPSRPGLAPGTETTSRYDSRPPSPPNIEVLMVPYGTPSDTVAGPEETVICLNLQPTHESAQSLGLTLEQMEAITGNRRQILDAATKIWAYEDRRVAHPILDFLWLGPSSITRNHDFLRENGISMILVANEMRLPGQRLRTIDQAGEALGIDIQYVDVQPAYQQVASFNEILQIINTHVLEWVSRRSFAGKMDSDAHVAQTPAHATVLVVCETGNDRSAMIVASYIMAMYSRNMHDAIRYMLARRLSCGFDDTSKRALQTWGDILNARIAVVAPTNFTQASSTKEPVRLAKRGFEETIEMDLDDGTMETTTGSQHRAMDDYDRFADREAFTPFRDVA